MAAGFPVKENFVNGDVYSATNVNDLAGTLNLIKPTAKGDLFAGSAVNTYTKLPVGTNDQFLVADSAAATGLKWATGSMKLITSGSLATTATVISSIPTTYTNLQLLVKNAQMSASNFVVVRWNGATGANYSYTYGTVGGATFAGSTAQTSAYATYALNTANTELCVINFPNYSETGYKVFQAYSTNGAASLVFGGNTSNTAAITSITLTTTGGTATFSAGTYALYGA